MSIKLNEVLDIYKPEQLNNFLKKYTGVTLEEKNILYEDINSNWNYVGGFRDNLSTINILKDPNKGLIERITNGIDAVLEKEKEKFNIENPSSPDDIVKIAFPRFYNNKQDIINGNVNRQNACETDNLVMVAVNDSIASNKPTIDVVDKGIGIDGNHFDDTILSLHHGNKSSVKSNYLIGAFGQGGSTSLPFSFATIIVSKKNEKYYFTIIKKCLFDDSKMHTYLYYAPQGNIQEIIYDGTPFESNYLNEFVSSDSGTLVRMIDIEIDRNYRNNEVTKPGMLSDYINTELYNVALPVKVIDNRRDYAKNKDLQNRNAFGTFCKMHTWKSYVREDKSGTIEVEHNGKLYKINYYFILPSDENDWANDAKAKESFEQFNVHLDPIIYTVNGQRITSEGFTRLKNKGLSFLKYRLLVDINLDVLGKEKYQFFTSDRDKIQESDLTSGFLDKVLDALKNENTIIEMNNYIASKSINSNVDSEFLREVSDDVKNIYNKYLKAGETTLNISHGHHDNPMNEDIFYDEPKCFVITSTKHTFFKDDAINFIVETQAKKSVNSDLKIDVFISDHQFVNYNRSNMNGRIQFSIYGLNPGNYNICFGLRDETGLGYAKNTENFPFIISNLSKPIKEGEIKKKDLDLDVEETSNKDYIVDVVKNADDKKISIYVCLDNEMLVNSIFDKNLSPDETANLKHLLFKPLVLYSLFLGDSYDKIESQEEKNQLMLSLCNTINCLNKERK